MSNLLFPGILTIQKAPQKATDETELWASFLPEREQPKDGFVCPTCPTSVYVRVLEDEVICRACGTHLGFNIDCTAEYRWFGSEDRSPDPSRVGNPLNPLLPESSLGTRILARPNDSKAMRRIRQYHLWNIMPYRERTLWSVFEMLQVRASNAGISVAIIEETKQLYAQVSPLCICRGQQKDALLAACLFESLKRHDTPRRPADVADMFQIDVKLITRGVKQFAGLLEEHQHKVAKSEPEVLLPEKKYETPSTSFRHYLEPAIYKLETPRSLHGQILEMATRVGTLVDELGICPETTPSSLAASSLALICERFGVEKSNVEIAKVCSISSATLQKCLKRIESWKPVIFKQFASATI
jgi:transcription initiation factor TFIIIB Brf1 subunit/transcription initiation factor TFIIB